MNKIIYISVILALCTSVAALAQHPDKGRSGHKGKRFENLDKDNNGEVTLEEMRASVLERWQNKDLDKNGVVSREELKQRFKNKAGDRFSKKDTNGDGALSRDEVSRMPREVDPTKVSILKVTSNAIRPTCPAGNHQNRLELQDSVAYSIWDFR